MDFFIDGPTTDNDGNPVSAVDESALRKRVTEAVFHRLPSLSLSDDGPMTEAVTLFLPAALQADDGLPPRGLRASADRSLRRSSDWTANFYR